MPIRTESHVTRGTPHSGCEAHRPPPRKLLETYVDDVSQLAQHPVALSYLRSVTAQGAGPASPSELDAARQNPVCYARSRRPEAEGRRWSKAWSMPRISTVIDYLNLWCRAPLFPNRNRDVDRSQDVATGALDVRSRELIVVDGPKKTSALFCDLLTALSNAYYPKARTIHVILDNYATHKQPKVRAWLDRHPRWTFHFVPTSCSWLNAVEGFFAKLTRRRLKNGVFHSVVDLQAAINRFISEHNQKPRPFVWRANPDDIIAAVRRGHQTLESIH